MNIMQPIDSVEPYEQSELYKLRHTAAHVMAQAVLELFPEAKLGIGPPVDDGFYYDFDLGEDENARRRTFTPADLERIERRMRQIIAGKYPLRYRVVTADEARELFKDQPYKLEIIDGLLRGEFNEYGDAEDGPPTDLVISTYRHDTFEDLCKGPHVAHTGLIPVDAFQLMGTAAAYWRGDQSRPMLQRIYGTAFFSKKELKRHLQLVEEAKKRDHRKLGRELEIYIMDEEVGPGLPLWLPNGTILREELEKLAYEMEDAAGYQRVATPHIAKEELYRRSGHLPYFADSMFPPMERDETRYYLKPMNCPFHHKIFAAKPRSYRDLPLRLAEYGMVYRYEQSGELFGLMRVRAAEQNDAHIYCAEEQVEEEFMAVIDLYRRYFDLFGIDRYVMRFSKHDRKGLGVKYADDEAAWLKAEEIVRRVMHQAGVPFEEVAGEAAFYGPKIDVQAWSVVGREFSLATNQVDFVQPARFELTFTNRDGRPETPYCIHRAPLGAHERYIGFLIEHYDGNFPVWLSPEQARVIPITDEHHDYARRVVAQLTEAGIRVHADLGSERMGAKIRAAQLMKVPYMLIVGGQEAAAGTLSVRLRDGEQRNDVPLGEFAAHVQRRIRTRSPEL
ncbi:MAG: threonine--tRNA ligase [Anaerolineae bacterium]|nr:MAG: threonine--tRNA ligase [Anaerolineae bacterium]